MNMSKKIYLIRHGETEWTLSGRHTGKTDIPLTQKGEEEALRIGKRIGNIKFDLVLCSPMQRAKATCQGAGLLDQAVIEPLLTEWDYGAYEGLTTKEIRGQIPDWKIFTYGAPGGESVAAVGQRADQILDKIASVKGDVALFSHGHFLRVLCARWLRLPAEKGALFALSPAALSILGSERADPVLSLWNSIN
jgi:broad specificity phosphatase PhoE